MPLLDALTLQVPHLVVLADRKGADVLAYTAGPDPVESASVQNRFPDRMVHAGGSDAVIADEVLRVLSNVITDHTIQLLENYAEARGRDNRAAEDTMSTVATLRMSQVSTLLLTDARDTELDEALVRAALGTGASVRFVGGGMAQSPAEGVGALLRY